MHSILKTAGTCIAIAILLTCSGCGGSSNGKYALSGTVTLQGQAIDGGTIQFFAEGETTPTVGALVSGGSYSVPAEQGLLPGKYLVKITAPEAQGTMTPEEYAAGKVLPPAKERIPARYNTQSEQTVEVKTDGRNRFDFKIE
ncbi:hypothetical protein NA78x_005904 [Anatilimnocola sp. NA78]|uniref:hypothetical protein n=1 Tax=Anatilimnocola sp. NA78 TaxID=3415683 RepID=UPI003CE595C3